MYDNPKVMELYNKRDEFDLIFIDELFNELAYPFLVGKNYAVIATSGISSPTSAILGNVINPSYAPSVMTDYPRPYSFIHRISNLVAHISFPIYWRIYEIFPLVYKLLSERFPDLPPLAEIEKGISLVLANTHYSLDIPLPLLPSQVEVGGMHCHPAKKLPKDLQSFIDGSGSEGVIYFSLGSIIQGTTIPEKYRNIFVETFGKLKQRVIWKFEDEFENLPQNIIVKNWLPQQDILGHPKVKLFINQGGLLSMQESIYHGTPLLTLPLFGEQVKNAEGMKQKGFGDFLIWEDLTVEVVITKINEIINNPSYKSRIENASNAFRDQPMPPLEKAVWWTEYVIRNKGAPQLRSPARDLSWIEYLMIDLLLLILFIFFLIFWTFKKLIRFICSYFFETSSRHGTTKTKFE
ncbi:UDP-glucuronosyltransferase 2B14 [Armadillidium vulgare]|nr:UDP-glucuronosyltransferase 2B14 [Armadillidium vulgare]